MRVRCSGVLSTSVRGFEMPVIECPPCVRGPPCVFVYCTCTANLHSTVLHSTKNNPVLTVYFQKWANAGRCWAADQHLLRSYKRFECNRDLKLSEVRCLEYRRSFTTRRAIFTSSSRPRRQFLTQHPPHGIVVASP